MKYYYCPNCGTKYREQVDPNALQCAHCGQTFYLGSKPTGSTIITSGTKVLLGKRLHEPEKGKWDIIGGFLDNAEDPEIGAKREAKEETGLDVEIVGMIGIFMDEYGADKEPTLNIYYQANVIGGEAIAGDDIGELKWFDIDELPTDIAFKNGKAAMKAWLGSRETKER